MPSDLSMLSEQHDRGARRSARDRDNYHLLHYRRVIANENANLLRIHGVFLILVAAGIVFIAALHADGILPVLLTVY